MNETVIYVDTGQSKICDLDVCTEDLFIAYTDSKEVITADTKLLVNLEIKFPIIRFIDSNTFLLVDARTDNQNPNAYIFDFTGQLIKTFLGGDGIQDILIHNGKIVITYFDEGVFGEDGPNNNGLSVFNLNGEYEYGFNENSKGLNIYDCYCICKHTANKVVFYAYDFFNVIELNLDNFKWEEFDTPTDFKGASAMTSIGHKIIFHSSYHDKTSFFLWDKQKKEVTKIGEYSSELRGLENGKFLASGEKGFTIIDILN